MRKLVPMTFVALCAFAAPAFAQDPDVPDMDGIMEKVQDALRKLEESIQPLLEQLQQTVNEILAQVEKWLEDLDPQEMFGEFDYNEWMEKLREMFETPQQDDDEEFVRLAPLIV